MRAGYPLRAPEFWQRSGERTGSGAAGVVNGRHSCSSFCTGTSCTDL